MNGHDEYLELLAASIDFGLTEEEVARLNYHLASCPECRRAATELRGQNAVIATTPISPLAPARSEQILRGALRKPAARPRWGMLAVAALLATLGGGVLFAGFQMITDDDPAPDQSPPIVAEVSASPSAQLAEESADPGGEPPLDGGPRVTPNPGDDEPPPPADPAKLAFPLPYSSNLGMIRVAPARDDRLWVSVGRDRESVLALLDADGQPIRGWPKSLPFAEDCYPLAASDGSVRLLCYYSEEAAECSDGGCAEDRVFAFTASGQPLAGFPVSFPFGISGGVDRHAARMVGDAVLLTEYDGSDDEGSGIPNERWLVEIRPNGNIVLGARIPAPLTCCFIGPNGVAYGSSIVEEEGLELRTQVVAFDAHGLRPGWPIVVDGNAVSHPSFGPSDQLVFSSWIDEGSRIARLNPDGSEAAPSIDLAFPIEWSPDGDSAMTPLADDRGNVWVVADGSILGFDAGNAELPGFPYEPETGLLVQGNECGPQDTGCQSWIEPPRLAPQSLIYALEAAPEGEGGRITVINRDGSIRSGWPKTLQREGAAWDSVTIGENRRAYAVAIEPEPNDKSSISILAFAPNGTREWITTLVEP